MCDPVTIGLLVAGSTAVTAYSAETARKSASQGRAQALRTAESTAAESERAINRANKKTPDLAAMLAANQLAATGGQGSTMLTGPGGVDPNQLTLGKSALIGGG